MPRIVEEGKYDAINSCAGFLFVLVSLGFLLAGECFTSDQRWSYCSPIFYCISNSLPWSNVFPSVFFFRGVRTVWVINVEAHAALCGRASVNTVTITITHKLTFNSSDGGRVGLRLLGWRKVRDRLPSDMVRSVTSACTCKNSRNNTYVQKQSTCLVYVKLKWGIFGVSLGE